MRGFSKVLITLGFLGVVSVPAGLEAQMSQTGEGVWFNAGLAEPNGVTPNPERARALQLRAEELYSQPTQWKKAARLLEQSVQLREANDPDVYTCLMYAGRLRAAVNDLANARVDLERAATHALSRGSVIEAAHALIDAAHVAIAAKDMPAAHDLVRRASMLTESPLLSAEQKAAINARLKA
jgi:hypothetical protein